MIQSHIYFSTTTDTNKAPSVRNLRAVGVTHGWINKSHRALAGFLLSGAKIMTKHRIITQINNKI